MQVKYHYLLTVSFIRHNCENLECNHGMYYIHRRDLDYKVKNVKRKVGSNDIVLLTTVSNIHIRDTLMFYVTIFQILTHLTPKANVRLIRLFCGREK